MRKANLYINDLCEELGEDGQGGKEVLEKLKCHVQYNSNWDIKSTKVIVLNLVEDLQKVLNKGQFEGGICPGSLISK